MSSDDSEAFKKFFQAAADGGWKLLQYYMCGPTRAGFRTNQRGNGLGGIHCARNSHKVIPLHIFEGTSQHGRGRYENAVTNESEASTCSKPVVVKMVTPAQQSTEQARANLKREAQEIKESRGDTSTHSLKRRRRTPATTKKKKTKKVEDTAHLPIFRK